MNIDNTISEHEMLASIAGSYTTIRATIRSHKLGFTGGCCACSAVRIRLIHDGAKELLVIKGTQVSHLPCKGCQRMDTVSLCITFRIEKPRLLASTTDSVL